MLSPSESRWVYATRPIKVGKKDGTNGRTPDRCITLTARRSKRENITKEVGATSGEGFLVLAGTGNNRTWQHHAVVQFAPEKNDGSTNHLLRGSDIFTPWWGKVHSPISTCDHAPVISWIKKLHFFVLITLLTKKLPTKQHYCNHFEMSGVTAVFTKSLFQHNIVPWEELFLIYHCPFHVQNKFASLFFSLLANFRSEWLC